MLLDRGARGSRLTPAGALLVDWAAPLLAQARELDTGIASLRCERDAHLRVAASMTVAEHLLPGWLVALRAAAERAGRPPADTPLTAANSETVARLVATHDADSRHGQQAVLVRVGADIGWACGPRPAEVSLARIDGDVAAITRASIPARAGARLH